MNDTFRKAGEALDQWIEETAVARAETRVTLARIEAKLDTILELAAPAAPDPTPTPDPPPAPAPAPDPPPVPAGHYSTRSGVIIDPAGDQFIAHGVNAPITIGIPFVFDGLDGNGEPATGGGFNTDTRWSESAGGWIEVDGRPRQAALKAMGGNAIRATVVVDADSPGPSRAEIIEKVSTGALELADAGFVITIALFGFTVESDVDDLADVWRRFHARVGHHPRIWPNVANEPAKDGHTVEQWTTFHRTMVASLRAQGWAQPIVVDLPRWGQAIDLLADGHLDEVADLTNVVLSHHAYGAVTGSGGDVDLHRTYWRRALDKGHTFIIGEYGIANPPEWGNAGPWQWNVIGANAVNGHADELEVGRFIWATGDQTHYRLYSPGADRKTPLWELEGADMSPAWRDWLDLGRRS